MSLDAKIIGKKIAVERVNQKMTQTELAEKLSISSKAISKWENGNGLPNLDIIPDLAKTLKISVDDLLGVKYLCGDFMVLDYYDNVMKFFMPRNIKLPDVVKDHICMAWLNEYLYQRDIDIVEFLDWSEKNRKIKSHRQACDKLLDLDNVTCSGIQRKLKVGYPKATEIRDDLVKNNLIEINAETNQGRWIDNDINKLNEIVKKYITIEEETEENNEEIENVDFNSIILSNEEYSEEKLSEILKLLKDFCDEEKNVNNIDGIICSIDKEDLPKFLKQCGYKVKVKVFDYDVSAEIKDEIESLNINKALFLCEGKNNSNIFDFMNDEAFSCSESQFALKLNDDLKKQYRVTIIYF